jgi:hypothetical protein
MGALARRQRSDHIRWLLFADDIDFAVEKVGRRRPKQSSSAAGAKEPAEDVFRIPRIRVLVRTRDQDGRYRFVCERGNRHRRKVWPTLFPALLGSVSHC